MSEDGYGAYVENMPRYFRDALDQEVPELAGEQFLICGMGGSGISGLIAEQLEPGKVVAYRGRHPPLRDVDAAIIISYSGNTEETLSCYDAAKQAGLNTVVVTSGGALKEKAGENGDATVSVPDGLPPRAALPFLLTPVLRAVNDNYTAALRQAAVKLEREQDLFKAHGEALAEQIAGKTPVLYAAEDVYPAAYRVKTQVNENAKQHAFSHVLPEAFHNEIVGYEKKNQEFFPVFLLRKGMGKADRMAELTGVNYEVVRMDAPLLDALLQYIHLGDWLSVFLADLNGVDPVPVNIIDELKAVRDT